MKKIRRGNDFVFAWEIERNGLPEDLSSVLEKHLYLSALGKRVELVEGIDYDITGNVVRIEVTPTLANILGTYKAEFHYILPDNGLIDEDRKCAVDVDAFIIVGSTAQADDPSEFTVTSDMAIAFKGDKGDKGDSFTYADFTPEQIAELQQPATDAIASIQEVELAVETAEGLRVQAELNRQTNTSTAILNAEQATDDANDAAILANEKAGLAATATTEANTARDEANLAATAANTAAGLADTARTELTTAVNTKLGEANDKIEEMDTTLSTYDGRVAQVESDISQLAVDVSELELKDVVQSDKIKDIENVISTMNPNQSAQLSVLGVSPLSLPKNAANGGMSVKLEGLTEDVGGVITNFEPTGRVRSVGRNIISPRMIVSSLRKSGYMYADISDYGGVPAVRFSRTDLLGAGVPIDVKCEEGTQYALSTKFHFDTYGNELNQFHFGFVYSDGSLGTLSFSPSQQDQKKTLISALGKTITQIRFTRQYPTAGDSGRLYEIKLERGSGATTYEPYKETNLYLTAPELRSNGLVKDEIRKGANGYELVKRISEVDGTVLATPVISPISYGGILNSAENGTVYHEPIITDAGVYDTKIDVLLTDYPIATIEEIIKHVDGIDTYLDVSTAVIAGDKLSFTHPSLQSGDLVLFTYSFSKETTNGNITATFYDSNVVKIDTVTGKAYKITDVVTNGVLTRTLTEV